MDISTTPKRNDDINHAPVPKAEEEHDTEITVIVTPPAASLKPILKHSNTSLLNAPQSPQKIPATTNEIRVAMTSSPSSPESPEHNYSTHEAPGDNEKAGNHKDVDKPTTKLRTRRVKRTLTFEFNQMAKFSQSPTRRPIFRLSLSSQRATQRRPRRRLAPHQSTTERNFHYQPRPE